MLESRNRIKFFENIPAVPNREMVLTRLGYRKNLTMFGDGQKALLAEGMCRALSLCHAQGVYGRFKIVESDFRQVRLENQVILESESLSKLLKDSDEVVLMAATVGMEIVEAVRGEVEKGDAALGVVMDAVASQTADGAVAWVMDFVGKLVEREGKKTTKHRYSPGFGDLSLANQKDIFHILDLGRIGLSLTEKFMLIPEKSVIAIAGIERSEADE